MWAFISSVSISNFIFVTAVRYSFSRKIENYTQISHGGYHRCQHCLCGRNFRQRIQLGRKSREPQFVAHRIWWILSHANNWTRGIRLIIRFIWLLYLVTTRTYNTIVNLQTFIIHYTGTVVSVWYSFVNHCFVTAPYIRFSSPSLLTSSPTGDCPRRNSWRHCNSLPQYQSHVTADGHLARLSWCKAPSGAHNQICITFSQLWGCSCGAPSLTKGQVSRLQLLMVLASAVIFGIQSRRI
jgi:hypothetical protein